MASEGLETLIGANPAKPAEKTTEVSSTAAAEPKKETNAAPNQGKTTTVVEPPRNDLKVETRTAGRRKLPEQLTQIPTSVPVETVKKTDVAPVEEKPVETVKKTDAEPVEEKPVETVKKTDAAPVEEKPVETIKKTDAAPNDEKPVETIKKAETLPVEEKPIEKNESQPVSKIEENQIEPKKLPEKLTDIEAPKRTELQKVDDKPVARDEISPLVTKVEGKIDDPTEPPAKRTEKPLFEPVVIEVKRSAIPTKTTDRSGDPDDTAAARRTRVIENKEIVTKAPPPCTVTVSEENISLVADGGSIGVLVGVDGEVDPKLLAAAASSPKDIEVTRQPEIAGVSGRAYFVIKSLTNAAGEYKLTFAAPCGKKEVNVKVH